MRILPALLLLLPSPALAWQFSPLPLCTLSHGNGTAEIVITYDPGLVEYRLDLTKLAGPWEATDRFGMSFDGMFPLTIRTNRQEIAEDRLTVRDSGFGNVLNGLEYNAVAVAFTDGESVFLSLAKAAEPVRQFRECASLPPMTS